MRNGDALGRLLKFCILSEHDCVVEVNVATIVLLVILSKYCVYISLCSFAKTNHLLK